jgi:hypothetical protein
MRGICGDREVRGIFAADVHWIGIRIPLLGVLSREQKLSTEVTCGGRVESAFGVGNETTLIAGHGTLLHFQEADTTHHG